jgi:hypothetical protein
VRYISLHDTPAALGVAAAIMIIAVRSILTTGANFAKQHKWLEMGHSTQNLLWLWSNTTPAAAAAAATATATATATAAKTAASTAAKEKATLIELNTSHLLHLDADVIHLFPDRAHRFGVCTWTRIDPIQFRS